jgi:hypothetical protein
MTALHYRKNTFIGIGIVQLESSTTPCLKSFRTMKGSAYNKLTIKTFCSDQLSPHGSYSLVFHPIATILWFFHPIATILWFFHPMATILWFFHPMANNPWDSHPTVILLRLSTSLQPYFGWLPRCNLTSVGYPAATLLRLATPLQPYFGWLPRCNHA